jgi:hypothetical protein
LCKYAKISNVAAVCIKQGLSSLEAANSLLLSLHLHGALFCFDGQFDSVEAK